MPNYSNHSFSGCPPRTLRCDTFGLRVKQYPADVVYDVLYVLIIIVKTTVANQINIITLIHLLNQLQSLLCSV